MELRQLRYFVAVVDEGSFTRAAEHCNIAQPALSRAIAALERSVGADLLVRTTRSVGLTQAGRALLEPARRTLLEAQRARHAVRATLGGTSVQVRMGLVSLEYAQLDPVVSLVRQLSGGGDVGVLLDHKHAEQAVADVRSGCLDAAVVFTPVEGDVRGLEIVPLRQDRLVAVVPAHHALAPLHEVELRDLRRMPLIVFPRSVMPQKFSELTAQFRKGSSRPRWLEGEGSLRRDIEMVAQGRGVAVLPEGPAAFYANPAICLLPIVNPALLWGLVLVCRISDADRFHQALRPVRDPDGHRRP